MNTKLTLRLDENLIRRAKLIARRRGKSVSQIVGEYFQALGSTESAVELTPTVQKLYGALHGSKAERSDYRAHLEKKYR